MNAMSHEELKIVVDEMLARLGVEGAVQVMQPAPEAPTTISITSDDAAKYLIGKGGQTLQALEHIVRLMWSRKAGAYTNIVVDVNDYRREQAAKVTQLAHQAASRVRMSGKSEALDPMTAAERRIIHTELATYNDLVTESIGQDPNRRVVIKPL
ncbi:MAG TPA: R3H domain-containing nucleic acid-binding protein [Candidatus Paceibacterota bacterium]|nr:R3H domain-containing nucleic acid-binding protein [Candidatus Paceibacterota bacterium]